MSCDTAPFAATEALGAAIRHSVRGCYETTFKCSVGFDGVLTGLGLSGPERLKKWPFHNRWQHHFKLRAPAVLYALRHLADT